jgi:hypothetical protein
MRRLFAPICLLIFAVSFVAAQSAPPSANVSGWYSAFAFGASHDTDGWNNELGSTFGYDVDRHWALESGVPLYFVIPSSSVSTTTTTSTGSYTALGDAFVRAKYDPRWQTVRYNASITATAPTGNRTHGISSGHATWNWDNKVETDFGPVSPYLQASLANTLANTLSYQRAFTTYGFVSQQKGGLSFDLGKGISLDTNYYNVAPLADQTIFSHVRGKGSSNATAGASTGHGNGKNRVFEDNAVISGSSSLAKDHGFGAGISANPTKRTEWSVDYNRSIAYQLNTISTTISYRFGHVADANKK